METRKGINVPTFNAALREPPPRCEVKHPRSPKGQGRRRRADCPDCARWDAHIHALNNDRVRTGSHVRRTIPALHRPIVPARPCPDHGNHAAGCNPCRAYTKYLGALRRHAERTGTLERRAPATLVRKHLENLLNPETGGWFIFEIAKVSGVSTQLISDVIHGRRTKAVLAHNWNALRGLKPKGKPRHKLSFMVDATELRRTAQGLAAQGWTFGAMAQIVGKTGSNMAKFASRRSGWTTPEAVDQIRLLRDKLGEYDVALLPEPLPGMNRRAALIAAKKGWLPLSAWVDRDIADPAATPWTDTVVDDDQEDPESVISLIDSELYHRVREIAQRAADVPNTRPGDQERRAYIDPIGRVTRLEAHVVAHHAVENGLTSSEIAKMLGYPSRTKQERDNGERQAARIRANIKAAWEWIKSGAAGETPDWYRGAAASTTRVELRKLLPALVAVQPAPYGAGWTVAELAVRCGIEHEEMSAFLAWAKHEADRIWARRSEPPTGRTRIHQPRAAVGGKPWETARAA
jgi:hypothetical protein